MTMQVFLSARARAAHRDILDAAGSGQVDWLALHDDGSASIDGTSVDLRESRPEVAWMTSDVIQGGPMRQFFGLVTRSDSLGWLQSSAAGFDHPVFGDLVRRGVRLTPSHIAGPPIADFVLRAALDHLQDADRWREAAREHRWEPHEFTEMASTRWLVIGLGTIGAEIAVRSRSFGAHVTGVRRAPDGSEPVDALVGPDQVHEQLPDADVVVLAVPASASTTDLVDDAFLSRMKSGALLVNVGRGSLIVEGALLAALDSGTLSRAVLDVTRTEPLPGDDPLWSHPRVIITPHSSALGDGRHARAAEVFAANLRRYLAGEPLSDEVTEDEIG